MIVTLPKVNDNLSMVLEQKIEYKNHAYFFIPEKGYFDEYLEY
jgi:hypothetical protein